MDADDFAALRNDMQAYGRIDVFAPVVKDEKGILSPCILKGAIGRRVKRADNLPETEMSLINSGLAVRLKVFKDYRYDEGLFPRWVSRSLRRVSVEDCVLVESDANS